MSNIDGPGVANPEKRAARVLLIEDNHTNLKLMEYLLQADGYETVHAMSGEEGLGILQRESVDLVICDIQLPGISGTEVAKQMKTEAEFSRLPIIAVTALAMVGDRDRIMAAGFDGYLSKPLDPKHFVDQVEAHLPHRQRGDGSGARSRTSDAAVVDARVEAKPSTGYTVLLVDDQPDNLKLLRSLLQPNGFQVLMAASTAEALQILKQQPVNLVLADLHLPGSREFELLQTVKNTPEWAEVPVIMLSSTSEKQQLAEVARRLGAETFLFRPVGPSVMLKEVQRCLHM